MTVKRQSTAALHNVAVSLTALRTRLRFGVRCCCTALSRCLILDSVATSDLM